MLLWNGTTLPYRQAVVPACLRCNRDRFAPLEKRIREGSASRRDYFLWALKISFGLGYRDTSLVLDRAKPQAGPLIPVDVAEDMGEFVRHALRGVDSPKFRFSPEPFGSVILIEDASKDFVMVDVPRSYRAVAIALPGKRQLIVLPGDRGVVAKICQRHSHMEEFLASEFADLEDEQDRVAMRVFALLVLRSHLDIPRLVSLRESGVFAVPVPRKLTTVYQPPDTYRGIAAMLRLPRSVADAAHSRYADRFSASGYVRWR